MEINKTRSIGISLSYCYFALNTVISLFMSAFILRTVGKTDYGVYQSMSAFVSYLVLLEFGTGTIMARNISLCKKDGSDSLEIQQNVSTIWALTVILGIIICIFAFVFFVLIDSIYSKSFSFDQIELGKRIFIFASVNLIFSFFTQTINGLILGYEYYTFEKTISIIKLLLRTVLLVVLLQKEANVIFVVAVDAVLAISVFIVSLLFCIIRIKINFIFRFFDIQIFRLIMPLAIAMLLQTIVNTANGNVDKFLISIMMTPEDVAVYSVSMSMFLMFSSIATLPVSMYMPQIAKNMRNGLSGKALTETLIQPCRLNIIITGIIAFGFLSVGRPFIEIIYGVDYSQAWLYAVVVIIPMFMNMFNAVVVNVIDVLRKRHVRSLILMITTTLNIILTIVGIQKIGMLGAALATGISLIGQTVLLNIYYQKKIGLSIRLLISESFKGILFCLLTASISAFLIQLILDNIYFRFFTGGILFVAVFCVSFIKFAANNTEKEKIRQIYYKNYKDC